MFAASSSNNEGIGRESMNATQEQIENWVKKAMIEVIVREFHDAPYDQLRTSNRLEQTVEVRAKQDSPEDGWYAEVEIPAEPPYRKMVYDLFAEVEESISERHKVEVLLIPWPEQAFDYDVEGQIVEVVPRHSGWLWVRLKNWTSPGPHYNALFDSNGTLVSTGAIKGGFGEIPMISADLVSTFRKAADRYLGSRSHKGRPRRTSRPELA